MEIPYGDCKCGCGQKTKVSPNSNARYGYIKGEPRNFCHGHYSGYINRKNLSEAWEEEDTGYTTPCHIWKKSTSSGYARIGHFGNRSGLVHQVLYEEKYGSIDKGLVFDHLCNVTVCVNPDHLEPVTQAENARRHHERERQEWDDLLSELFRCGDDQALKVALRITRRRELTRERTEAMRKRSKR